jgi:hypothetical protein
MDTKQEDIKIAAPSNEKLSFEESSKIYLENLGTLSDIEV